MKKNLLKIDPEKETEKIVDFLKSVKKKTKLNQVVLAWSGGIDSTVSLYLLIKAYLPQDIFIYHFPYQKAYFQELLSIAQILKIPQQNIHETSIKESVDSIKNALATDSSIRLGNIMARVRMIYIFDQSKKHQALVCGTENRSEHFLGYFTRYGDAASDIEPITHLYKTQVYEMARYLGVPQQIIDRTPTADLWTGQTDEGEFGFSYKEADEVLSRHFDKKETVDAIKQSYPNADKILLLVQNNFFKKIVPYKV